MKNNKKPAIFCVAGWAQEASALSGLLELLKNTYDVNLLSTYSLLDDYHKRCCGDKNSSTETSPTDLSSYARELNYKINELSSSCTLLGWSMGGIVCLELLCACAKGVCKNNFIDKIILINSTSRFTIDDDYKCGVSKESLSSLLSAYESAPSVALKMFFELMYSRPNRFPNARRTFIKDRINEALKLNPSYLKHGLCYLQEMDLRSNLKHLCNGIPMLIIHATDDKVIPISASEFIAKNIPNAHLTLIKTADHSFIKDSPELVAEMIVGISGNLSLMLDLA